MFSLPEYAFRRNKKITKVFRGEKIIWADREEAKHYRAQDFQNKLESRCT